MLWTRAKYDFIVINDIMMLFNRILWARCDGHLHLKAEDASFSGSIWVDIDLSIVLLYDLLDDRQAQPKPFMIDVGRTGQFTKSREQFS